MSVDDTNCNCDCSKWPDPDKVLPDYNDPNCTAWVDHDKAVRACLETEIDRIISEASRRVSRIPPGEPDMVIHWALIKIAKILE